MTDWSKCAAVESVPGRLSGAWVFTRTRVPVSALFGNLAAGARGVPFEIGERERRIARQVGPVAREKGLIFVGLDVIGDHLTEVNVTSPTCIREIEAACDIDIAGRLMDAIASRLVEGRG